MTTAEYEALEQEALAGSAVAFGRLVRHYDGDLRGLVWSVVRNGDATDDVMQAAYEKAFRSVATFAGRSSFKTWLSSICYRTAIDHMRYEGRRRHQDVDAVIDLSTERATDDTVIARHELETAFSLLDMDQRVVLMMTAGLGFTFDEVADMIGINRGTVASRASRAKGKLRKELER